MSETFEKISKVLDGDVPRAGGEVETLAWRVDDGTRHKTAFVNDPTGWAHEYEVTELVDRSHITRVQAENAALQQRLNVADQQVDDLQYEARKKDQRLLLLGQQVQQSDVMINASGVREVALRSERDALKAEVERLKYLLGEKITQHEVEMIQRIDLQSELTKAREFLVHIKRCLVRNKEYAPLSHQELDGLIGHSPSASCRNECACLWCHQSAPAAKGEGDE